jgi:hypothetical protein
MQVPRKDFDRNRLISGILQLPDQSHLFVDETALLAGRLSEVGRCKQAHTHAPHRDHHGVFCIERIGTNNLSALAKLCATQTVEYDFQFNQIPFQTNVQVCVFSEGKSMLPVR